MSRRRPSWSAALRDLKADRAARRDIREERLATPNMAAWRGTSARRYVVAKHPLCAEMLFRAHACVAVAVHRDGAGTASIVRVASGLAIGDRGEVEAWIEAARQAGANELHIHPGHLAGTATERDAIVADLTDADAALVAQAHARGARIASTFYGERVA